MRRVHALLALLASPLLGVEPLPLVEKVEVGGLEFPTDAPQPGFVVDAWTGLFSVAELQGQVVHRTTTRVLETRATLTPGGDYLLMFPEGDHYAKSKGEKVNSMMACRSKDRGRTWSAPVVAYDIPYGQHGFIPLIPRGSRTIYCFGTQPVPGKWSWQDGKRENAPIGWRTSDDDGHSWSEVHLIEPVNDPGFMGMSVMRMTETEAGTWLLGSHLADWSVKPFTTRQYLLRTEDRGRTWTLLPGPRPGGWFAGGFNRMDEGRPLDLGGGRVLFMSRTPAGRLFTAWSEDDGRTWTEPAPSPLVHPDAPPMLFPLSDGKTLAAFHHNRVPRTQHGELNGHAELMKMRSELWVSLSRDGGHTWSEPGFLLANAAAPLHRVSGFNSQCSYLDAFTDDGVMQLFLPHRWQQVLHLTFPEKALAGLPTRAALEGLAAPRQDSLRLPAVISDHMVLQAGKPVELWGWERPGSEVTVDFAGQSRIARADERGRWQVTLDPLSPSGEGRDLRIGKKVVRDVVVGEVWLASGQSNMAMQVDGPLHGRVDDAAVVVAAADHPGIRVFVHDAPLNIYELPVPGDSPAPDRPGRWRVCSPDTVALFSAMGYFFARDLEDALKKPVGILAAAVGGTPIEAWISREAQDSRRGLQPLLEDWKKRLEGFDPAAEQARFLESKSAWLKQRAADRQEGRPDPKAPAPFKNLAVMKPGGLFGEMISPLVPYTLRGVLWYQGERNAAGPFTGLYGDQLGILIRDWRSRWGDDFHFALVQLSAVKGIHQAPIEPKGWGVEVCEGQRRALALPGTCMAVTLDLGGERNGHPTNKVDYARRLSRVVLRQVYQVGAEPVEVRYAWAANPRGNLVNGAGLPASPFQTDPWK